MSLKQRIIFILILLLPSISYSEGEKLEMNCTYNLKSQEILRFTFKENKLDITVSDEVTVSEAAQKFFKCLKNVDQENNQNIEDEARNILDQANLNSNNIKQIIINHLGDITTIETKKFFYYTSGLVIER